MTRAVASQSSVAVHEYRGDATHQESIEKSKVHVSKIVSSMFSLSDIEEASGPFDINSFSQDVVTTSCYGDLLTVAKGDGKETYAFVLRQIASVGCPTWEDKRKSSEASPDEFTIYTIVVDAGGDNQSLLKRVGMDLTGATSVCYIAVFCFLHQIHLISKAVLKILDEWQWSGDVSLPTTYFSGIATIANTWRSTGNASKIRVEAARLFGEDTSDAYFKGPPGRCLRGRWLSVDSAEKVVASGAAHVGKLFYTLWGGRTGSARVVDLETDADKAWSAQQSTYKRHAVQLTSSSHFLCMALAPPPEPQTGPSLISRCGYKKRCCHKIKVLLRPGWSR